MGSGRRTQDDAAQISIESLRTSNESIPILCGVSLHGEAPPTCRYTGARMRSAIPGVGRFMIGWLLLTALLFPAVRLSASDLPPSGSGDLPVWGSQVLAKAAECGYGLITPPELESLIHSGKDFVLLDVRPPYEFSQGHLPGAVNLEFHLGHLHELDPGRKEAFEKILGPDPQRNVVIYCRSFR